MKVKNDTTEILRAVYVGLLGMMLYTVPAWADDFADLLPLVTAEGAEYVQARDALLERQHEPWDVAAASRVSWEIGLAAYILNQRASKKTEFETLDDQRPRCYRHLDGYAKLTHSSDANTAFLLEKMWKAAQSETQRAAGVAPDKDRQFAYNTLIQTQLHKPTLVPGLWSAMWEHAADERLKYLASFEVCADPDPSAEPLIVALLHGPDDRLAGYRAKSRCLAGLWHRDTKQTVDAVLGAWDLLCEQGYVESAIGALAVNSSPRAREFVHEFILNPANSEVHRAETAVKCCNAPQPDDAAVFRRFLAGSGSTKVKAKLLHGIGKYCPLPMARPILQETLLDADDPEVIAAAALALSNAHTIAKNVDERVRAEDAALLESVVATRDDLSTPTRVHIDLYIRRLRAKPGDPRPELPDRLPDD